MAGTWLDTETTVTPNNYPKLRLVKAYEEGVQARLASNTPGAGPHPAGSDDKAAWDAGVADAAAGTIDPSSAYRGQTGPVTQTIDLAQLAAWMQSEGWTASNNGNVSITNEGYTYTQAFLQACDYSAIDPPPRRTDLCQGVQMQGFCTPGNCT